ncbi:hypothetical protein [Halopiger djelfimassiliensis]|uniref:hypothetical protein n=1 Tax=Halopiger djelfimassiliensis TaxID=1293047 RepID=UPI000677BE85|nr:hypothetical protein [Halopiger djelfimassiliensis]
MRRRSSRSSTPAATGRLQAGFILLVGLSTGTMALSGGATPWIVALSVLGGIATGSVLLWYLRRIAR